MGCIEQYPESKYFGDCVLVFQDPRSNLFQTRVSFKMLLDGVGVVQWQSLGWLSKLADLPSDPWYTIHLPVVDIQNKVEQATKLLFSSVEIINRAPSSYTSPPSCLRQYQICAAFYLLKVPSTSAPISNPSEAQTAPFCCTMPCAQSGTCILSQRVQPQPCGC